MKSAARRWRLVSSAAWRRHVATKAACTIAQKPATGANSAHASRLPTRYLLAPHENPVWQKDAASIASPLETSARWEDSIRALQTRLGIAFRDVNHLKTAMTHASAVPPTLLPADASVHRLSNRSLEFLGDSVLGMAVASYAFQQHPRAGEGELTRLKMSLVNNETLSKIAVQDLQLGDLLRTCVDQDSFDPIRGKARVTIQAGAVEALIAAIYIDQGLETALEFVNTKIVPAALRHARTELMSNAVNALQALLQAHGSHLEFRRVPMAESPVPTTHDVELWVDDKLILRASGDSYRDARHHAAARGYEQYSRILQ